MLMLLEAWEGINLSRNVAFSKQKKYSLRTVPLNRGDGDFDMVYGDGLTTREGKRFEIAFWSTPTQG